jgi:hypothetical protein
MVSNVGWGDDATHTRSTREPAPAEPMPRPLQHPPEVALNTTVQQELEFVLLKANGRLANLVRAFVPSIRVRGYIRRVVNHPLVGRVVRWVRAWRRR